jgi:hypothetical protein
MGSPPSEPELHLRCNHIFHAGCIDDWLRYHFQRFQPPQCPVCKIDIRDEAYDFMGELYQREVRMAGSVNKWPGSQSEANEIVPRDFRGSSAVASLEWVEGQIWLQEARKENLARRGLCWERKLAGEYQRREEVDDEAIWWPVTETQRELLFEELARLEMEAIAIVNLVHALKVIRRDLSGELMSVEADEEDSLRGATQARKNAHRSDVLEEISVGEDAKYLSEAAHYPSFLEEVDFKEYLVD